MISRTFFFNENAKNKIILDSIKTTNQKIKEHIKTITKMKSRNKIGYFQFLEDNTYFKIYIMPKIYLVDDGENNEDEINKKRFITFLNNYYKLIAKYDISKYSNELDGNISDLNYQSTKDKNTNPTLLLDDIEDFIVHNYEDSLKILESFFIKHKQNISLEEEFKSQSVKNKLNVKKNLLSLDKSYVHQLKNITVLYSTISTITIIVLRNFLNKKVKNFSQTNKALLLKKEANKLINLLNKKFPNNKQSFHIKELLSRKTSKLFEKNDEYRKIYKALLKLAGKEHYYNGDSYRELKKEEETISLFFQPEKLYEWIVYDKLVESNFYDEVLKCDKDSNVKESYSLEYLEGIFSSEPDIIVKVNEAFYPIDVKWKILSTKDASFDNDISKLRRDAKIRNVNKGFLIYPLKNINSSFKENIEYSYSFEKDFKFELMIINID